MSFTLEERSKAIDLLEAYSEYLMKHGYLDTDWYAEEPHTVVAFLETKEFKNVMKEKES